jgi:hypothetical protein
MEEKLTMRIRGAMLVAGVRTPVAPVVCGPVRVQAGEPVPHARVSARGQWDGVVAWMDETG